MTLLGLGGSTPPLPPGGGNPPTNDSNNGPTPPQSKWLLAGRWLLGATLAFYLTALVLAGILIQMPALKLSVMAIVATLAFCHMVIASITVVREQELAVLIFFGVILKRWDRGLHYALAPFYYVRKETRNSIQVDFGTVDEKDIDRVRRAKGSVSWLVMPEPVRIDWGSLQSLGTPEEKELYANDPYANVINTNPHMYFRVRIVNLQELIEETGGLIEALERIKVTCIRALQEQAGKTFVAKARNELDQLSELIKERVEDLVGDPNAIKRATDRGETPPRSWGLDIEEAAIQDLGTPHETNKATAERGAAIAKADGEAIAIVRKAKAERAKIEEEAAGKARATELAAEAEKKRLTLEGEGRAAAITAAAQAISSPGGELIVKTDTLKEVMTASGGKIVVVPTELSSLTGVLAGATEAIEAMKDHKSTKPPSS